MFGDNGELSTTQRRQPDGTTVELPMIRVGHKPPCGVCPKWDGVPGPRGPLDPADDFGGLFAELRQWWREGRAVGFPPRLDPLMRAVAALFHTHDQGQRTEQLAALVRSGVGELLVAARLLQRL